MIDRMTAKDIITKEKDASDGRVSRIYTTKKGKKAVGKVVEIWIDLEKKSLKGLSKETKDELRNSLRQILKNFD